MAKSVKKPKKSQSSIYYLAIALVVIATLAITFFAGYVLGGGINSDETTTQHHMHSKYEVQPGEIEPKIDSLDITKDAKMGWNLNIKTSNFNFTPGNVNKDHISGQGHAHLYINDEKITRLYSNHYYIKGYEEGIHKVKVTLNTNSHADYYVKGQQVKAEAKIVGSHGHDKDTEQDHEH